MNDSNKPNSFLHTLYQKYVKKQQKSDGNAELNSTQLIEETMQEIHGDALSPEKQYLQPLFDLYLYYLHAGILKGESLDNFSFEGWCLEPVKALPDYAVKRAGIIAFEKLLSAQAAQLLRELTAEEEQEEQRVFSKKPEDTLMQRSPDKDGEQAVKTTTAAEDQAEVGPKPRDAVCRAYITGNKMTAYLFAIPPCHGGSPLDRDCIVASLEEAGIQHGWDDACIERMVEGSAYLQIFQIAQGSLPVDGKDGTLIPQIDYSAEIEIQQNERGISDFKNINSIHCLTKDQLICALLPPEEGIPGKDVKGGLLPARNGKAVPDPSGKNTRLSEDKSRLLAALDGQLTLKNGRYHIEPVLVVNGNVDYGVGNVYFNGDVIIKGDVCTGFTVKAEGSVTVQGMVESADIIAGGDVEIFKGMNGNFNGFIDAQGEVKTRFLENCTVYAGGALYASSIIASKIFCGDTVYVLSKHGAIIGGTVTAFKSVEAKMIGSQSRRETDIILGEVPRMSEKKTQAETELKGVEDLLEKLNKNLSFLAEKQSYLPADKLEIFEQLKLQRTLYASRREELTVFLSEIAEAKRDFSECRIKCDQLFPPTKITIGSDFVLYKESASRCLIYRGAEGIVMGSL